jgi:phosphoglycerate dehydrogenase-like enzyme
MRFESRSFVHAMSASRHRIVVLDDWTHFFDSHQAVDRLRQVGEVTIHHAPAPSEDEVIARLESATIAIANRERSPLNARVLGAAQDLELLAQTGRVGPNVDLEAASRQGIAVTTGPGVPGSSAAVAELGLGLLLALARQIPTNDRRVRSGDWVAPPTIMLKGLTLGILGLGQIGSAMARFGRALEMQVIAWGPTLTAERAAQNQVEFVTFDDLFRRADVLFISPKLSELTRGIVGAQQLAAMKPSSYVINIARGPIVDEMALVDALHSGRLAGAGLDVYDVEPLPASHALTQLENVILTPHIGWGNQRNFSAFVENLVANVVRYLDGDMSVVVNPEALESRKAASALT